MKLLSMKIEYALLAMLFLALKEKTFNKNGKNKYSSVFEISKATGVPANFLSKIMMELTKANLVRCSRGANGGYALSKPSEKISTLDVIESVEGKLKLSRCASDPENCSVSSHCPFYSMWIEAQESLEEIFRKYTLHSLAVCIQGLPEETEFFEKLRENFIRDGVPLTK